MIAGRAPFPVPRAVDLPFAILHNTYEAPSRCPWYRMCPCTPIRDAPQRGRTLVAAERALPGILSARTAAARVPVWRRAHRIPRRQLIFFHHVCYVI